MKCKDVGCNKDARARGLCLTHYNKLRREGGLPGAKKCVWDECDSTATAKGRCWKHYRKDRRDGVITGGKICTVTGCAGLQDSYGVCATHYGFRRRRGLLPNQPDCTAPNCERKEYAKGYCSAHLKRLDAGLSLEPRIARRTPGEWSDWKKNNHGYIVRYRTIEGKSQFQSQHRLVMEEELGRALHKDENVHHINGVRDDNRVENLELWSTSQPYGQRVKDKVKWAEDIMRRYAPDKLK